MHALDKLRQGFQVGCMKVNWNRLCTRVSLSAWFRLREKYHSNILDGFADSCTVLLTLRSPAVWGFTRTIATCGFPELLLMADLLLVEAGNDPDGALGAGGGMPAADVCRDCAAAAAAAALARWASASCAAC